MRQIIKVILIVSLVAAIFGGIISFVTVRFIVFLGFIYLAYYQKRLKSTRIVKVFKYYIFIAVAILFNPIFQIYLYSSFLWILIDIIIVFFLLVESEKKNKDTRVSGNNWNDLNKTPYVQSSQAETISKKSVVKTSPVKDGLTIEDEAEVHNQPSVNRSVNMKRRTKSITSYHLPTSNHIIQNSKNHAPSHETQQTQSEEEASRAEARFHPNISQPFETDDGFQQVKEIRFIHPYYPTRYREHDPGFIQLKEMDRSAITKYTNDLQDYMYNHGFLSDIANTVITVVPSHDPQKQSTGIKTVANEILRRYPFIDGTECLIRYIKVDKSTYPGANRSTKKHLESISVKGTELIKDRKVIIIDDITTTGNSLKVCKELVKQAGAKKIQCIAIAKTIKSVVNGKPVFLE